jgi:hypothetical protein
MLWLIQNILFSISLIVVIHYLYIYFETTLTAPKVKDLIHCPKQKYKSLFDTINKNLDNNLMPSGAGGGGGGTGSGAGTGTGTGTGGGGGSRTSAKSSSSSSNLGIDDTESHVYDEKHNLGNDMKTDLKAFLRGIGLKSSSSSETTFRPTYETS